MVAKADDKGKCASRSNAINLLAPEFAVSLIRKNANWFHYAVGTGALTIETGAQWADAFWQFSTALYAVPKVEAVCLELQDRDGLEVNLALFCLFAARHHVRLDVPAVQAMRAIGFAWGREVVAPLREARRSLKANMAMKAHVAGNETVGTLREEVKRVELAAEKAMQAALIDLFIIIEARDKAESPAEIAADNFAAWFDEEGVDGEGPRAAVATLIHAAFDRSMLGRLA